MKRVKRWYVGEIRVCVEQDATGEDQEPFDGENSIRVDLECLKGRAGSKEGHVKYLDVVVDVGVDPEKPRTNAARNK